MPADAPPPTRGAGRRRRQSRPQVEAMPRAPSRRVSLRHCLRMARWLPSIRSGPCVRRPRQRPPSRPFPTTSSAPTRRAQLAAGNPLSFLHVTRSEIDLPPDTDPYAPRGLREGARATSTALRDSGAAGAEDDAVALLLPAAHGRRTSRPASPAASRSTSTSRDVIKKHERTRRDKEDDRTRHIVELRAQTGVVFLTYRASGGVDALAARR